MPTLLENYLKIHKIHYSDIARAIGVHCSYVQKTVKAETYATKMGPKPRQGLRLQHAIANYLGLSYELECVHIKSAS